MRSQDSLRAPGLTSLPPVTHYSPVCANASGTRHDLAAQEQTRQALITALINGTICTALASYSETGRISKMVSLGVKRETRSRSFSVQLINMAQEYQLDARRRRRHKVSAATPAAN